jgi:hypothetical protein
MARPSLTRTRPRHQPPPLRRAEFLVRALAVLGPMRRTETQRAHSKYTVSPEENPPQPRHRKGRAQSLSGLCSRPSRPVCPTDKVDLLGKNRPQ